MKLRQKVLCISGGLFPCILGFIMVLGTRQPGENKKFAPLPQDEWRTLMMWESGLPDAYEHLLRYKYPRSVGEKLSETDFLEKYIQKRHLTARQVKLSDIKFMEKYALFLVKEIHGDFKADYRLALDKGDSFWFIFEEKDMPSSNWVSESKARDIVLEKITGRVLALAKTET